MLQNSFYTKFKETIAVIYNKAKDNVDESIPGGAAAAACFAVLAPPPRMPGACAPCHAPAKLTGAPCACAPRRQAPAGLTIFSDYSQADYADLVLTTVPPPQNGTANGTRCAGLGCPPGCWCAVKRSSAGGRSQAALCASAKHRGTECG